MIERVGKPAGERTKPRGNYFSNEKENIKFISSGSKLLDLALGGGWAEGRIANIVGDRSTGKSLLMIEAAANFVRKYKSSPVRYRETESAFDIPYAEALGMPIDNVDFGKEQIDTVEAFFEDIEQIAKTKGPQLYILDSLDALSDVAEMERDISEGSFGAEKAKKLSQMFRRTVRRISAANITMLIVSQVRAKIGITFGRKTQRTGGMALDFYASHILYLSQIKRLVRTISGIERPYGITVRAKVDKNKIALPLREADFKIIFGYGVDDVEACLEWLKTTKHLDDLGISADGMKDHLKVIAGMSDQDYHAEVGRIHKVTARRWYEIETELLPTRRKYQ